MNAQELAKADDGTIEALARRDAVLSESRMIHFRADVPNAFSLAGLLVVALNQGGLDASDRQGGRELLHKLEHELPRTPAMIELFKRMWRELDKL